MSWEELSSVTGADGQLLGKDVDISGNYAIVGDANTNESKVFFYQRKSNGNWEEIDQKTVVGPCKAAISGNYAIAGFTDTESPSVLYFYQRQTDGKWEEIDRKTGIDPSRIAISGNYAAIGQAGNNIIFYQRQTDGKWEEIDRTGDINLDSLAMDGNNLIAGNNAGDRIYFYQRHTDGKWEEIDQKVNDVQDDYSVGISGNYAVTAQDQENIIIFYQKQSNGKWEEIDRKSEPRPFNVSIDGNYAIVTAGSAFGNVQPYYIFYQRQTDGKWEEIDRKTASGKDYDNRGVVSGNYAIIGTPGYFITPSPAPGQPTSQEGSISFYLKKTNRDYYGGSAGPLIP